MLQEQGIVAYSEGILEIAIDRTVSQHYNSTRDNTSLQQLTRQSPNEAETPYC